MEPPPPDARTLPPVMEALVILNVHEPVHTCEFGAGFPLPPTTLSETLVFG